MAERGEADEVWLYESAWWTVIARVVVGGAAGLIILLLANSGVLAVQIVTAPLISLLAFAFGLYIEKFVGVVETLTSAVDRNPPQEESDRGRADS